METPEHVVTLRRAPQRNDGRFHRNGRSLWVARDERKGYSAVGKTRSEAVGKLMLDTCFPSYVNLRIVG